MLDILPLLLRLQPFLSSTTCRQLNCIVMAILVMPTNVTQRSISRWTGKGGSYRTVHRFFHTSIDWLQVKWLFFMLFVYKTTDTYLLVADETVLKKAGKQTFGLDRFFSSSADRPVPGVAFFVFALLNVQKREAYTLCAEQVVRTPEEKAIAKQKRQQRKVKTVCKERKKKPGRPQGSKNKNKSEIILSPELQRIFLWTQKVMALVGKKVPIHYFVLDGHFGNHPAYQMTRKLGLHLISKMRHNAALCLLPDDSQKQAHPHLKYGNRVDYDAIPISYLVSCVKERDYQREIYQMPCLHKDFSDIINVVVLVKTHLKTKRRGHVVLLSSDLSLDALTLIDYYSLRFQIEFEFRDAKQHFGLSDFCCVSETAVKNSVSLAFFMGNLSLHLLHPLRQQFPEAGVYDLKSHYRGHRYVSEVLKCLPDFADEIVCSRIRERVCRLGLIHTGGKFIDTGEKWIHPRKKEKTESSFTRKIDFVT